MTNETIINEFAELEVIADLWADKATKLRNEIRKARAKLAGVSTPAVRKGRGNVDPKIATAAVAKRLSRLKPKTA